MNDHDPKHALTENRDAGQGQSAPSDRDVLFGRLAVVSGFINQITFDQVLPTIADSKMSMGELLVDTGAITEEDRQAIDQLLARHIARHGDDPQASLTSLSSSRTVSFALPPSDETATFSRKQQDGQSPSSTFADYELLDEIAAGGMGVVFKARQTKLNRLVALKMIRSGELADNEQVKRFYSEAEAAGRLDHPGIVPVFEVGEANGQHFYSMAFVEGQSLHARVNDAGPLDAKEAASLMKSVADAAQFAHDKGIVHRDIKPQNVLLDSKGQPRVTDFGLAKHVHGGSDLTATGQIMGTPSYMPPEQAAGRIDDIGPTSDVYALGATLYFLLTGRPPFRAASTVETIRQVIDTEPVSPRKLNPDIPRDLETICLKSLRKEKAKRYSTATELAADLGRWLESKPIVARPVSRTEKLWLWCNRRPAVASLVVTIVVLAVVGTLIAVERQNATHAKGLVEALVKADTAEVPNIVKDINGYRRWADPLLHDRYGKARDGSTKKLHLAIALLPVDPKKVDYLTAQLLVAKPEDVDVIRRALFDHKNSILDDLWRIVEKPTKEEESQLLQAASALALYDSKNERWEAVADKLARTVIKEEPFRVPDWTTLLHPIRGRLIDSLGIAFRNRDGDVSQTQIDLATSILKRYATDDVEILTELILDAQPNQFVTLFFELKPHKQDAIKKLNRELDRQAKCSWNDDPLGPQWAKPDPAVVKQIESTHGLVSERFAFCQTMPLEQFIKVAESLRKSGYRPIRFRPFAHSTTVQVAAVWTRDGRDWRMAHGLNVEMIRKQDEELRGTGFMPLDVAGYVGQADGSPVERYGGVWVKRADKEDARMYMGASSREHSSAALPYKRNGFLYRHTMHAFRGLDDSPKYSGVLSNSGGAPAAVFNKSSSDFEKYGYFDRIGWDIDISKSGKTEPVDCRYAAVWQRSTEFESQEAHGLSPEEHFVRCREMISKGYRPAAISAASIGAKHERVTASVWHRPPIPEETKEQLAKRQANAAIGLLRLGQANRFWPLLKHSPDPRLRTWIINRLASLSAAHDDIVKRLNAEPDVSIRRALVLMLGGYMGASHMNRESLSATLLKLYRDDPDPGVHGAAEWVLRRWGKADALSAIDTEFATGEVVGERKWYLTKQGHTMVVISGPVEFLMGSPSTAKNRSRFEYLHHKRIGRSFAIASKEVTIKQFREFLRKTPNQKVKKMAFEETCPQPNLTWYDAAKYCRWLSEQEGIPEEQMCYPPIAEIKAGMKLPSNYLSRTGYRLPSEAEWEFACRSKTVTSRYYGHSLDLLGQYAWSHKTAQGRLWPVGTLKPNDFGVFDMLGNVTEWCQEPLMSYLHDYQGTIVEDREDLRLLDDSKSRVMRGGAAIFEPWVIRSAQRNHWRPNHETAVAGFRPVRTLPQTAKGRRHTMLNDFD